MSVKKKLIVPRSFKQLNLLLQPIRYNREELIKWAAVLKPYQLADKCRKKSISCQFFESYGLTIAQDCGCTWLFFDHMQIIVPKDKKLDLICEFVELYRKGYFPKTSTNKLAYIITGIFKLDIKQESIASMIRMYVS